MFQGRKLVIATMHSKEKVISSVLEKALGVVCVIPSNFNTDLLGTFSGEVERKLDPIATAREKCLAAMEQTELDLAVASEGSFGAHPNVFFAPADDEFLVFIDKKNSLEIVVRELSTKTNFNGVTLTSEKQLKEFAETALFPSHGLILRKNRADFETITKGITDWETLLNTYNSLASNGEEVYVETDMRANFNPSRMLVIQDLAEKLAQKINSACPNCATPGFDVTSAKKGLPCELCGQPTNSTLSYLLTCQKCHFSQEKKYPNNLQYEDPMYCNHCNP